MAIVEKGPRTPGRMGGIIKRVDPPPPPTPGSQEPDSRPGYPPSDDIFNTDNQHFRSK